jgi:hypothetical protein
MCVPSWGIGVCSNLSSEFTNNFLSEIIIGDETWCFQYDSESKLQFAVETANIPTAQESSHVKIKN